MLKKNLVFLLVVLIVNPYFQRCGKGLDATMSNGVEIDLASWFGNGFVCSE